MSKNDSRLHRARQTRLKIAELNAVRLAVHRTNLHICAQVFSGDGTKVLASASTAEAEIRKGLNGNGGNTTAATLIGKHIAEKAKAAGIEAVALDRPGFRYHDRVKALTDVAREAGLKLQAGIENVVMVETQPKVQGDERDDDLREKMIAANHVTKVVKGGRIFGFTAPTVVGDSDGRIGTDKGEAREAPVAVQKAMDEARRKMVKVPLENGTLQHEVADKHGATKVQMMFTKDGTDVIANGPIRVIFEVMGVTNIVTKSHGSTNPYNMVHATLDGLRKMSTLVEVTAKRGKSVEEILG